MEGISSRRPLALVIAVAAVAALAVFASATRAADRVYWSNFDGPEPITYADLGSTAVTPLNVGTASTKLPFGLAIDPVGGRIYWANSTGGKISYANLDGSGGEDLNTGTATVSEPSGVAIDPAARRIYWANQAGDKISWANLDGSGGGDLDTKGATVLAPAGLTVDPAAGRVYWTNDTNVGSISFANLGGGGGGHLPISGTATLEYPLGLAIDQAAQKIYWTNDTAKKISVANLNGSGSHDLKTVGATVSEPYGVAIDPEAGRVYWGNTTAESIAFARLDETGGMNLPLAIPKGSTPGFPVLMETPRSTGAPQVSRRQVVLGVRKFRLPVKPVKKVGSEFSCTQGGWASDLVESFLYRAPLSLAYQWTRDGTEIAGAATGTLRVSGVGEYRCRATATNWAGSSSATSLPAVLFRIGKAKLIPRRGTALLPVSVPGAGTLVIAGKGLVARTVKAKVAKTVKVTIKAKGKVQKALTSRGGEKIRATLTFTPAEGPPASQSTKITLRKRTRP